MRVRAPRAVADLLMTAVPGLRERLAEHHVRRAWAALVGADVARRAQPQALVDGCLAVVVDNSPWLHELTLRAEELTARFHERVPVVRALRFTLGSLEPAEPPAPRPPRRERAAAPLPAIDRHAIDTPTSVISDPTLAAAARRLLTKAWRSSAEHGAEP